MMGLVKASSIEHIEHGVAFPSLMGFSFLHKFFICAPKKGKHAM
jgi:hypothetical protein